MKNLVIISAKGKDTFSIQQQNQLEKNANVTYMESLDILPEEELVRILASADYTGLTPRSVNRIHSGWIDKLPQLKGIAVFATGVDYIDVQHLHTRGILLSHLPDYSTISVAEHAVGLMLTMSRRIHLSQDRVRGRVPYSTSVQGFELYGKTVGIIGMGRIGSHTANIMRGFGTRVLGYDITQKQNPNITQVALDELLMSSDMVSLHMPSEWQGSAHFGSKELEMMKPGSYLVNVARAALVDNEAILHYINKGHLKGYAVDDRFLIENEQAEKFIMEGRIIQTGHTAWYSKEVIERGYETWVNNMTALVNGKPQHLIVTVEE